MYFDLDGFGNSRGKNTMEQKHQGHAGIAGGFVETEMALVTNSCRNKIVEYQRRK